MRALCSLVFLTGCSLINNAAGNYKPSRSEPIECEHKTPGRVDAILAIPFALEAIVFAVITSADTHSEDRAGLIAGMAVATAVSGLFVGSSVYGFSRNADCEAELDIRRAAAADASARAERAREESFANARADRDRKQHVVDLGKRAAAAARAGDCTTVTTIDPELCKLDADYRDTVFVNDVAIARCLGTPQPCVAKPSE